jgi:hypothetical protein
MFENRVLSGIFGRWYEWQEAEENHALLSIMKYYLVAI